MGQDLQLGHDLSVQKKLGHVQSPLGDLKTQLLTKLPQLTLKLHYQIINGGLIDLFAMVLLGHLQHFLLTAFNISVKHCSFLFLSCNPAIKIWSLLPDGLPHFQVHLQVSIWKFRKHHDHDYKEQTTRKRLAKLPQCLSCLAFGKDGYNNYNYNHNHNNYLPGKKKGAEIVLTFLASESHFLRLDSRVLFSSIASVSFSCASDAVASALSRRLRSKPCSGILATRSKQSST